MPVALKSDVIPSYYLLYDDFLRDVELSMLLDFCIANQSSFERSEVTGKIKEDYRKSKVLYDLPVFQEFIVSRVYAKLPQIFEFLGIAPFQPSEIEAQITASNDGDFFREHTDSGLDDTQSRIISYVFYFWRSPKNFEGGDLKIWDGQIVDGYLVKSEADFDLIAPKQNMMIVFPSKAWHEVTSVISTGDFGDSRFTVNGWIRR
jgi:SM-20-related protein